MASVRRYYNAIFFIKLKEDLTRELETSRYVTGTLFLYLVKVVAVMARTMHLRCLEVVTFFGWNLRRRKSWDFWTFLHVTEGWGVNIKDPVPVYIIEWIGNGGGWSMTLVQCNVAIFHQSLNSFFFQFYYNVVKLIWIQVPGPSISWDFSTPPGQLQTEICWKVKTKKRKRAEGREWKVK